MLTNTSGTIPEIFGTSVQVKLVGNNSVCYINSDLMQDTFSYILIMMVDAVRSHDWEIFHFLVF